MYILLILLIRQELEEKTSKKQQLTNSQSLTHSNSELNSICPHKGSTKSKQTINYYLLMNPRNTSILYIHSTLRFESRAN